MENPKHMECPCKELMLPTQDLLLERTAIVYIPLGEQPLLVCVHSHIASVTQNAFVSRKKSTCKVSG
jgi:hypothetical protein